MLSMPVIVSHCVRPYLCGGD